MPSWSPHEDAPAPRPVGPSPRTVSRKPEGRFMAGVLNGLALALPCWAFIALVAFAAYWLSGLLWRVLG